MYIYIHISHRHAGYSKQHGYLDPEKKVMPPRFQMVITIKPSTTLYLYKSNVWWWHSSKHIPNMYDLCTTCFLFIMFGDQISLSWYMYISHSGWSLPIISNCVSPYPSTSPHYIPWLHRLASHGNFCIQVAASSAWPRLIVARHCLEPSGWTTWGEGAQQFSYFCWS